MQLTGTQLLILLCTNYVIQWLVWFSGVVLRFGYRGMCLDEVRGIAPTPGRLWEGFTSLRRFSQALRLWLFWQVVAGAWTLLITTVLGVCLFVHLWTQDPGVLNELKATFVDFPRTALLIFGYPCQGLALVAVFVCPWQSKLRALAPWLLWDNPSLGVRKAFQLSKKMMRGHVHELPLLRVDCFGIRFPLVVSILICVLIFICVGGIITPLFFAFGAAFCGTTLAAKTMGITMAVSTAASFALWWGFVFLSHSHHLTLAKLYEARRAEYESAASNNNSDL